MDNRNINNQLNNAKQIRKEAFNTGKKLMQNFVENQGDYIYILLALTIIFFIIFTLLIWISYTLSLKHTGETNMGEIYEKGYCRDTETKSFITAVSFSNPENNKTVNKIDFTNPRKHMFKNYYIKGAYNACCIDGYKNNWVSLKGLKHCIDQGARFLDFEIYSYNYQPVVAASTSQSYSMKETYNQLLLTDVFNMLNIHAFNNSDDPMIIHLRLKTRNKNIYDLIATYIETHLKNNKPYLLSNNYSINTNGYKGTNLLTAPVHYFAKKFIIIVDQHYDTINKSSTFGNYINLISHSSSLDCQLLRYSDILAKGEKNDSTISDSRNKYIIVLPNMSADKSNYDYLKPLSNGCQIMAMKFQNCDKNLQNYLYFFKNPNYGQGYSFVIKPPNLVYEKAAPTVLQQSEIILQPQVTPVTMYIENTIPKHIKFSLYSKNIANNNTSPAFYTNFLRRSTTLGEQKQTLTVPSDFASNTYYISVFYPDNSIDQNDYRIKGPMEILDASYINYPVDIKATGTVQSSQRSNGNFFSLVKSNNNTINDVDISHIYEINPDTRYGNAEVNLKIYQL